MGLAYPSPTACSRLPVGLRPTVLRSLLRLSDGHPFFCILLSVKRVERLVKESTRLFAHQKTYSSVLSSYDQVNPGSNPAQPTPSPRRRVYRDFHQNPLLCPSALRRELTPPPYTFAPHRQVKSFVSPCAWGGRTTSQAVSIPLAPRASLQVEIWVFFCDQLN